MVLWAVSLELVDCAEIPWHQHCNVSAGWILGPCVQKYRDFGLHVFDLAASGGQCATPLQLRSSNPVHHNQHLLYVRDWHMYLGRCSGQEALVKLPG